MTPTVGTVLRSVVVGMQGQDDITLVEAARAGDPVAFGRLFDRWFDRTYDVSWHIVRNRDTAAEIAQDSFLAAWQQLGSLRQPESFGGWVLRISRNRSLNRLERERRSVPSDDETVMAVLDGRAEHGDIAADLADQERDQLIWAAAAALGERDTSLLDLHLRHELTAAAIAEELDTTTNNVHQLLHRLKGRLGGAIRSWVLWRDGRTRCTGLAEVLAAAGVTRFGADAVRVISAHAADCEVCSEAQRAVLAPEALFAAVPVVAAPVALKAQAASGLMATGVPIGSAISRMAPGPADTGAAVGEASGGPSGIAGAAGEGLAGAGAGTGGAGSRVGEASALRSARPVPGRTLVIAGAAAVALVLALVTGLLLAGRSSDDDGDGGPGRVEEAEITASGDDDRVVDPDDPAEPGDPGGGPGATSSTTGPGGGLAGGEGEGGGGTTVPGGGEPGGPDPGGSGEPGGPVVPPGGGTTTTTTGGGSTGSTTTTTTRPDPNADPPVIAAFRATVGGPCGQLPLLRTVVLVWASRDADNGRLGLLGVLGADVPPSGSATRCVLLGDVYLLTVTGPGGQDTARLTIAL